MPVGRMFQLDHIFDEDVLLFMVVAESKSFSKAAEVIGRNQSSISKRILELEDTLGVGLFDRAQRPIRLTSEGSVLYHNLKRHIGAISSMLERLKLANSLKPVLRIGCPESLSLDLIPEVIKRLILETSEILQVTATSNAQLMLLLEHKLDVIITSDPYFNIKGLHRRLLFSEPSVILMSAAMARSKATPWSWPELQFCGKPFLNYTSESGGGRLNENYFTAQYLPITNRVEVDTNAVMVSLIRDDVGWTLARASTLMQTQKLCGDVVAVPMPEPLVTREVYFLTRENEDLILINRCYQVILDVLEKNVFPKLKQFAPWAADHVKSGKGANYKFQCP